MHDIDRTQLGFSQETAPYLHDEFEFQEFSGGELSPQAEIDLAHELLAVNSEQELEQFLGDFLKRAVSTVKDIARSPVGQAIGGVLKGVAKKALPMAGSALGGALGSLGVPGPLGAQIGSGIANAAGQALGLETEFGGGELEFEGARQFVRLAADTARDAVAAAQSGADPRHAAQSAAIAAASRIAPGLLTGTTAPTPPSRPANGTTAMAPAGAAAVGAHRGHSGRWVRHGHQIVLLGI